MQPPSPRPDDGLGGAARGRFSAVVFDLWETLVPLPQSLRDRGAAEFAHALDAPPGGLREAWSATRIERETGELEPVALRLCRELGLNVDRDTLRRALEVRVAIGAEAFAAIRADAVSTLRALRDRGLRIGLVSNCTSELPSLVAASPLAPLLDAAIFSCTEGLMKPDPRIFRLAAERLGVPPEQCVYVGDGSDDELPGAHAVGMTPVLLAAGDTPARDWAGLRVGALSELPDLIERAGD